MYLPVAMRSNDAHNQLFLCELVVAPENINIHIRSPKVQHDLLSGRIWFSHPGPDDGLSWFVCKKSAWTWAGTRTKRRQQTKWTGSWKWRKSLSVLYNNNQTYILVYIAVTSFYILYFGTDLCIYYFLVLYKKRNDTCHVRLPRYCRKYSRCLKNKLGVFMVHKTEHFSTQMVRRAFKGLTSGICRLLFVNTTFKVGPSSPAQSARASGGPMCLPSGNWLLRFYRVPQVTPCAPLLAGGYTPLPKGWRPETSWAQQRGIIFVWVHTLCFFF